MYLATQESGLISAKMVADSINKDGVRVCTIETYAPKFIDAEFEKHRMLSSNSSSSRARPSHQIVCEKYHIPHVLYQDQKGMHGDNELSEKHKFKFTSDIKYLRHLAEDMVSSWGGIVHKQHLNRYLEPWVMQKKVVTATEWDNFFSLRLSSDAQPEIRELATCMRAVIDKSEPVLLSSGDYHLPYISYGDLTDEMPYNETEGIEIFSRETKDLIKASIARCARVSYNNHDNSNPDVQNDIKLYDRLLASGHLSPFEHVATPMSDAYVNPRFSIGASWEKGVTHMCRKGDLWSGNFKGWIQYRQKL